jgi:hypothetical protein
LKVTKRSYPFPVLTRDKDDFVNVSFTSEIIEQDSDDNIFKFNIIFQLTDQAIKKNIDSHKAYYGIHVECPKTRSREIFKTHADEYTFTIEKKNYREKLEICTFIITSEKIEEYYSPNFNPDYDDTVFNIAKGSRLAIGDYFDLRIDEEEIYEKGNPIFLIQKNLGGNSEAVDIRLEEDVVIVLLSEQNFEFYNNMQKSQREFINATIGVNVLTYLLEKIKMDEYQDKRWAKVLTHKINTLNLVDEESLIAANKILLDPISKSLSIINNITDSDEEEE